VPVTRIPISKTAMAVIAADICRRNAASAIGRSRRECLTFVIREESGQLFF
jgi:hypothetical protein